MENFLGRENELAALQKIYNKDSFHMAVLFGRRRVGKTTLLNHFMERQPCKKISFTAVEQNEKSLLSMMKEEVLRALAPELMEVIDFPSFDKLFDFVGKYAEKEKVIFLIDEYPYLAKECPYIQSVLQRQIDKSWKNTNLFFIICGSLVSFMKEEVLSESAPLHGRSDLELKLRPFDYEETGLFIKNYSYEEKAIVYGLTGGVAKYIEQFDPNLSLDENIIEQFYSLNGYFNEEQVKTVVTGEKQSPSLYNSIVSAIATGHTKNSEIASCVDMPDITYPLKVLVEAEILEKRISKKPYYILNDSMLSFYFQYVNKATSLINVGNGAKYYEANVKPHLHDFMGKIFEKMAKNYLLKRAGSKEVPLLTDITNFQNSILNEEGKPLQLEIDLYGTNDKKVVLLGECKFKNEPFGKEDFEKFFSKVKILHGEDLFLCLFSLSGFSEYVKSQAKNVKLITLEEMYQN